MAYLIHLAILFVIYAILGISLNLVVGYTGLLSVTHAAFFGIGAYIVAILGMQFGLNFFVGLLLGVVVAGIISFLIGFVLSRLGGDYYVLGTVGFNYIVWSVLLNWQEVTRGPLGIPGISRPKLFGLDFTSNLAFLFLAVIILGAIYVFSQSIVTSSFGRVLKAIREDERAINVFGYNTLYYKLTIFMIAAAMAAIAGSLFASYITFISPATFMVMESVFILAIVILGGFANLKGSLLGALFLIFLPEALRFVGFTEDIAAQMRQAVYGLLLVVLMLYRPQGLLGEYKL
ncbi:branched-chain amino acid ABC transporter permease [Candidatus Jorgensenbacteria bacterium]|nr:branched-chain amino acid ABC transporter permease [Candidatus Jorgensenbacteria bacterium]